MERNRILLRFDLKDVFKKKISKIYSVVDLLNYDKLKRNMEYFKSIVPTIVR